MMNDDMKMEWEKMMSSMNNLNEKMKEMGTEEKQEMSMVWDHMMNDAKQMQDMMMKKAEQAV
ncbi:MAG: hypothetical protein PHQ59_03550 [Candidatus Daviesbacteria bacterium]|nr:hypothetical protein [Candidatus Daviesbacteria bacterium]